MWRFCLRIGKRPPPTHSYIDQCGKVGSGASRRQHDATFELTGQCGGVRLSVCTIEDRFVLNFHYMIDILHKATIFASLISLTREEIAKMKHKGHRTDVSDLDVRKIVRKLNLNVHSFNHIL